MKKLAKLTSYIAWSIYFLSFVACTPNSEQKKSVQPHSLTISEGLVNPIGFYDESPSFSWKLPVGVKSQKAYSIAVASSPDLLPNTPDLWESGKVESDQSLYVKYGGGKLALRQKAYWQVKFWDENGEGSGWSEAASFELGLLSNSDWKAKWISLPDQKAEQVVDIDRKVYKIQYLRKDLQLEGAVQKVRLYITAKGLFEAQINGEKVGEDVLSPGYTPYHKRIETLTYDVADMLQSGENTLGLTLAEGWHSGRLLFRNYSEFTPAIIAQLEVTYQNGEVATFVTDQTWKGTAEGPIRYSSIYDGEKYDANFAMEGWAKPAFDEATWEQVKEEEIDAAVSLVPKRHSTVQVQQTLTPVKITEPKKDSVIFDFGQNMVGVPQLNIPVKKGQTVTVRYAEMLTQNGEMYTDNYRSAVSTDFYTPDEDGTIQWSPKFTFHGFRYVELSGFDKSVPYEKSWVKGLVQYSSFEKTGTFTSSHEKLNQLQSNIEWGLKGNFLDIPTDCPQRNERLGWTGDAQVIAPTSIFIGGVHSFWSAWLQSMTEEQNADDGGIPVVIPNVGFDRVSSGWGDAATVVPWEVYLRTGDKKVLEENFEMMKNWVAYYGTKANGHIVKMFTFGDWLQPYSKDNKGETSNSLISTAYYARSIDLTIRAAEVLGRNEDKAELQSLFSEVRLAFQNEFFQEDGSVSKGKSTQTAYLLAIEFDLLTPELQEKAIPHLLGEIEKADNHLQTGFLGTPLLAPVLEKIGRSDIMFELLFKETYPSWFYSINQGATTMWERWDSYTHKDGFNPAGMNSFNHYAYGAIGQWMYERIAGIQLLKPGYKEILIAPVVGGPLTSAEASYDSPYGKVSSAWKLENGAFYLTATVPPNTSAKIIIPANTAESLLLNGSPFSENQALKLIKTAEGSFELEVQPGTYNLQSTLN